MTLTGESKQILHSDLPEGLLFCATRSFSCSRLERSSFNNSNSDFRCASRLDFNWVKRCSSVRFFCSSSDFNSFNRRSSARFFCSSSAYSALSFSEASLIEFIFSTFFFTPADGFTVHSLEFNKSISSANFFLLRIL